MPNTSFYGRTKRNASNIKVRLERRAREASKAVIPNPYKPRILGPNHAWQIFYKQDDAFKFARGSFPDLHVFSFESESFEPNSGQRCFLVTSYENFWHCYSQLLEKQRHHYELIPEAAVCHLYFDLEYSIPLNPERDGVAMTQCLIRYVCAMISRQWGIHCSSEQVMQLDSSTSVKFSRHLIFHLENAAFKDNINAGHFVRRLLDQLLTNANSDCDAGDVMATPVNSPSLILSTDEMKKWDLSLQRLQELMVKSKNNKNVSFCDTGVYTKNRNFRLYLSCKLNKANPLLIAAENRYKPAECLKPAAAIDIENVFKRRKIDDQESMFLASLVTNVQFDDNLRILQFDEKSSSSFNETKVGGLDERITRTTATETMSKGPKSPFPEIDEYITELVQTRNARGRIRRWTYFTQGNMLLYDIIGCRWCGNIEREHASNNIMLLADLKRGLYYQKCHDPTCSAARYKSKERPLPEEILNLYKCQDNWSPEVIDTQQGLEINQNTRPMSLNPTANKTVTGEKAAGRVSDYDGANCVPTGARISAGATGASVGSCREGDWGEEEDDDDIDDLELLELVTSQEAAMQTTICQSSICQSTIDQSSREYQSMNCQSSTSHPLLPLDDTTIEYLPTLEGQELKITSVSERDEEEDDFTDCELLNATLALEESYPH